jgi:hypothetical protein
MGLGGAARMGYEKGFGTYNPDLRQPRQRDELGRFTRKED